MTINLKLSYLQIIIYCYVTNKTVQMHQVFTQMCMYKAGKQYFDMWVYKFKVHEDRAVTFVTMVDICQETVNITRADITDLYLLCIADFRW